MSKIWVPEAPHLYIPRQFNEVTLAPPPVRLSGKFDLELVRPGSTIVAAHCSTGNLITDAGLNGLATNSLYQLVDYIGVGTGTTDPTNSQTSLVAQLARTSNDGGFADVKTTASAYHECTLQKTRVFTTAEANGVIGEVGCFNAPSGGVMWSRARIKDSGGTPTTITKTSDYELRVTYTLKFYMPSVDAVYTALVNGASQNVTTRSARLSSGGVGYLNGESVWQANMNAGGQAQLACFAGAMGAETDTPSGTQYNATSYLLDSYVSGSFKRTALCEWNASTANVTVLSFYNYAANNFTWWFQHQLTTGVAKTSLYKLVVTHQMAWDRLA
jgi:hypothetical protein